MGVFVFPPLVLPLTAWPVARLAEQHLHPRTATRPTARRPNPHSRVSPHSPASPRRGPCRGG